MKKIVLVCHHFVPYTPAVGGVARVWYLADYLSRQGFEVLIVSSDGYNFGNLGFPDFSGKVKIIYVSDYVKRAMQRQISALRAEGVAGGLRSKIMLGLKRILGVFAFPDFAVFALPAYYKVLKRVLRDEAVTAMLISAPSHSLLLLAIFFSGQGKSNIRFLADYRDGWNAGGIFSVRGLFGGWMSRQLEKSVIKSVDHVLFATNSMRVNTEKLFPGLGIQGKAVTIMNGYPESIAETAVGCSDDAPGVFKIGYFGVANDQPGSYRNIEPVLQALSLLRGRGFDFSLLLFGDARFSRLKLSDYNFVSLMGSVPHSEALAHMKNMNCLLMYHVERLGAREVVTGKLFDYISARKPILCVSPLDMEGAVMVREGQFGKVADFEDLEQICNGFSDIYKGVFVMGKDGAEGFSREAQYSKLLPLLS